MDARKDDFEKEFDKNAIPLRGASKSAYYVYNDLEVALARYVKIRTEEYLAKKKPYNKYFLFFIPIGDSYHSKIQVIEKLKLSMRGISQSYSGKEIGTLTSDRLGIIMNAHKDLWPEDFKKRYK